MRLALLTYLLALALAGWHAATAVGESAASDAGIVFERNGDLYAISFDGRRTVRLTNTPVWSEDRPSVSPDGRWIVYARNWGGGTSALWVMSVHDRRTRRLTAGDDHWPAWSPDGRHVYFSRSFDKGFETCGAIFRKRVDAKEAAERVTRPSGFHSHFQPSVSPDGRRIAFTDTDLCSGGAAKHAVGVVDRYGRPTGDLAQLPGNDHVGFPYEAPAWSPDGRRIALIGGFAVMYLANTDGTGLHRITRRGVATYTAPAWSRDGEWIAFQASAGNDIGVVRPDGTELRRLTRTKAYETSPTWLPRMPD